MYCGIIRNFKKMRQRSDCVVDGGITLCFSFLSFSVQLSDLSIIRRLQNLSL